MKLTTGQNMRYEWSKKNGAPGQICKLGYSQGSRGNSNFHSTWCVFGREPFRISGDSRAAWRRFVREYGIHNIR